MSLTQEEIKKIAEFLSKLHSKNEDKLLTSVNSIVDYFSLLQELDTDNVEATVNVVNKKSTLRGDLIDENKVISREDLLTCSNQKVIADQIAISNIMN